MRSQVFLYVLFVYSFSYSMDKLDQSTISALTTPSTTVQNDVLTAYRAELQARLAQDKKIITQKEKVDSRGQRSKQFRRVG